MIVASVDEADIARQPTDDEAPQADKWRRMTDEGGRAAAGCVGQPGAATPATRSSLSDLDVGASPASWDSPADPPSSPCEDSSGNHLSNTI